MRIALVGDSQSQALWPRVKKALSEHQVVLIRSQPGWDEAAYKREGLLGRQLREAAPDLVVVELGGNNARKSATAYQPGVDWVLDAVPPHVRVVWLGPARAVREPYASNKDWTRGFQESYLPGKVYRWIDSYPYTQDGQRTDGVHFTSAAYDRWASQVVPEIRQAAAGREVPALSLPVSLGLAPLAGIALGLFLVGLGRRRG